MPPDPRTTPEPIINSNGVRMKYDSQLRGYLPDPVPVRTPVWETFCDECYYHLWCVRKVTEREFGQGYHVVNEQEANNLVRLLNEVAA